MSKISIVSPVLNCEKYIKETIQSVLSQSFTDWEWIVMDGKSTDETLEIFSEYSKNDSRIKVFSEKDSGPLHAFEKAIMASSGEYMAFLCGQDGYLDNEWLSNAVNFLDKERDISLVWALNGSREKDGGVKTNDAYLHFLGRRSGANFLYVIFKKIFTIFWDILIGSWSRKKFLFKKIFSKSAVLRINSISQKGFSKEGVPQKVEWFLYWLKTGLVFPDQAFVVSRKVFLDCTPRYKVGDKKFDIFCDFFFNFNSRGYLAYHIPQFVHYSIMHNDDSSARFSDKIEAEASSYFSKVADFKKEVLSHHREVVFRGRAGNFLFTRKF